MKIRGIIARVAATILPILAAVSLASCAIARQPPMPVITGSALALPPVGNTMPVYVYLAASTSGSSGAKVFYVSADRETIFGVTPDGKYFSPLSVDDAASGAGGVDVLLTRLSDEGQIAHVLKKSGMTLGGLTLGGLALGCQAGLYAGAPLGAFICAGGGALGAAAGLVGAVGVGGYLAVSEHARKADMLEWVSLPKSGGTPLKGYVFLPAKTFKTLKITVKDQRGIPSEIEIAIVGGTLDAPGQTPITTAKSP